MSNILIKKIKVLLGTILILMLTWFRSPVKFLLSVDVVQLEETQRPIFVLEREVNESKGQYRKLF